MEGGKKWFKSGDEKTQAKYEGEIVDGIPAGLGTLTYPGGHKYEGDWKDGEQHGQGAMTYKSGSTYVGEWENGLKHGQGTFTWAYGGKYIGEWKNGGGWNFKTVGIVINNPLGWKAEGEYKDGKKWNWKIYNEEGSLVQETVDGKQTLNKNKKQ